MVVDPKVLPKSDKNATHVTAEEGKEKVLADNNIEIVKAANVTDLPVFVFEDIPQRDRFVLNSTVDCYAPDQWLCLVLIGLAK